MPGTDLSEQGIGWFSVRCVSCNPFSPDSQSSRSGEEIRIEGKAGGIICCFPFIPIHLSFSFSFPPYLSFSLALLHQLLDWHLSLSEQKFHSHCCFMWEKKRREEKAETTRRRTESTNLSFPASLVVLFWHPNLFPALLWIRQHTHRLKRQCTVLTCSWCCCKRKRKRVVEIRIAASPFRLGIYAVTLSLFSASSRMFHTAFPVSLSHSHSLD